MRLRFRTVLPLLGMVCLAGPAHARMEQAPSTCAVPAELPAPLASWRNPAALKGATDRKGAARSVLEPGKTVTMALSPTPKIDYPVRPAKPGGSVSFGGLAGFTVREAGTWRVALGSGAWVDVVKDGKAAPSVAHGHGPDCSGIRKMVDYELQPGSYTLQISANGEDRLTVLVTPLQ